MVPISENVQEFVPFPFYFKPLPFRTISDTQITKFKVLLECFDEQLVINVI